MKIQKLRRFKVNGAITYNCDGVYYSSKSAIIDIYITEIGDIYDTTLNKTRMSLSIDEMKELKDKKILTEVKTDKVIVELSNQAQISYFKSECDKAINSEEIVAKIER